MQVHPIPSDGNCLFGAILHQLRMKDPQRVPNSTNELRTEVVNFIRDPSNLEEYIPSILDSCSLIYDSTLKDGLTENELVSKYLYDLTKDGFWGGAECLSATSRLWKTKINVHVSFNGNITSYSPAVEHPVSEINIVYSGVHYDSVILTPDITTSSNSTTHNPYPMSITNHTHRNIKCSNNRYTHVEEPQAPMA